MRFMGPDLAAIAFFLLLGWAALWPSRDRLGAWAYHLAALPIGVLAAPLALAVSSVTGRPLDLISAAGGGVLLIAGLWIVQRVVLKDAPAIARSVAPATYGVTAAAIALMGVVFGVLRLTSTNYDSVMSLWPLGIQLTRDGSIVSMIASSRSSLIPGMNAIHIGFGSDWAYIIYPVLSVVLAGWLLFTLWDGPLSAAGFSARTKRLILGGVVLFLVTEPSYIYDAFFVHSHLISGIYLLMALTGIWMAVRADRPEIETAYLVVAGASAAGLALTRPDGLAYQFVPVVMAVGALTISKLRWRDAVAFFAPLLFLDLAVYGATYLELGMWKAVKLGGAESLAILVVLVIAAAGPWIIEMLQRMVPFRVSGERLLGIVGSVAAVLMLAVFVLKWKSASGALANARINLFQGAGGYNYLWYAVVVLMVLSLFSGDALRYRSWTRSGFLAIALFFTIAGLVHGTSHEGRIGAGDSFNRVAFEVLPVIVWYVAAVAARIMRTPGAAEEFTADEEVEPDWEAA